MPILLLLRASLFASTTSFIKTRGIMASTSHYTTSFRSESIMASSSQQNCSVIDATFGPYAGSCRGGLDFTLLFEEIILCILPLFVAIVASTVRLMFLSKEGIKVIQSPLLPLKLVSVLNSKFFIGRSLNC